MEVSRKEWQEKLQLAKLGADGRETGSKALNKWHVAATDEAMKSSRTAMEQLNADWQNGAKQMQEALAYARHKPPPTRSSSGA